MKAIGVIPARYGSTRFAGKVLANLQGKPLLQHVWERARQSRLLNDVLIACDDERIRKIAQAFGAKAVLTSLSHQSGTDRIAEAVRLLDVDCVVNIQADEPLIHSSVIDGLIKALGADEHCPMATAIKAIDQESQLRDPNIVKVVIDQQGYALYFSRAAIPYSRGSQQNRSRYFKHLGIYAYRKDFLLKFKDLPPSRLEAIEQLEQLRALEAGYKIKTIETDIETISVDTKEDLVRVEAYLSGQN
jgi:3-deoxy-manno-octulosonate cytidylyltransferase (CMP-KDO synthetase)